MNGPEPLVPQLVAHLGGFALSVLKSEQPELFKVSSPATAELEQRVRLLLEDQALIATKALAGLDVSVAQSALGARAQALLSAGISIGHVEIRNAVRRAITGILNSAIEDGPR